MALVVEDGTGLATAESYLSVADFRARAAALGLWYVNADRPTRDWLEELADEEVESALRRATMALDGEYSPHWLGVRRSADQSLDWPRVGRQQPQYLDVRGLAYSAGSRLSGLRYDGYAVGSTVVVDASAAALPAPLLNALAHLAAREAVRPGGLSPDSFAGNVRSEAVSGAVSVTYEGGYTSVGVPPSVEAIVRPLLAVGSSGVLTKRRS